MLEVIAFSCAVLGTALALPQCLQIVRSRTCAGVSLLGWQLMTMVSVAWFVHGIAADGLAFLVPNGFTAVFGVFILAMIIHERSLSLLKVAGWPLALTLLAVGLRIFAGPVAFSLFILVPQIISVVGMGLDLIRAQDISGVSGNYLVAMACLQALWLIYGLLASDSAATISSTIMVVLVTVNALLFFARDMGVMGAQPGFLAGALEKVRGLSLSRLGELVSSVMPAPASAAAHVHGRRGIAAANALETTMTLPAASATAETPVPGTATASMSVRDAFDRWLAAVGSETEPSKPTHATPESGELCPLCEGTGYLFEGAAPRRMAV